MIWRPWVNVNVFNFNFFFILFSFSIACHLLLRKMQNYSRRWRDAILVILLVKSFMSHIPNERKHKNTCCIQSLQICAFVLNDADLYNIWCEPTFVSWPKLRLIKSNCAKWRARWVQSTMHRSTNPVKVMLISNSLFWWQTTNG